MPNWIGDAVMATPVIHDLAEHFPDAKITLMCQGAIGQLFAHDPSVSEILPFKKPNGWIHHLRINPTIEKLRQGAFDTGILLTNSWSSAWWFFRGRVKNKIGFGGRGRTCLLNQALPYPKNMETQHLVITYKELLAPLGISSSSTKPRLFVTEDEKKSAQSQLMKEGVIEDAILIGINPGAAYGTAKCWLPERFHEVAKELLKDPRVYIVFFGDAQGRTLTEKIAAHLGPRAINLAGKTNLRELMAHISLLNTLLTNDSGPMHMASGLSVPVVALFGSTNSVKTGPTEGGLYKSTVIHKHVECSPCYKRVCPIDFKCMTRIHSEEVATAIRKMLDESDS